MMSQEFRTVEPKTPAIQSAFKWFSSTVNATKDAKLLPALDMYGLFVETGNRDYLSICESVLINILRKQGR